jgi:hypothetical protein
MSSSTAPSPRAIDRRDPPAAAAAMRDHLLAVNRAMVGDGGRSFPLDPLTKRRQSCPADTKTVRALVARGRGPALGQPGRPDLDYAGLTATIDAAGRALGGLGIRPGVPVAIVLPNGPEMAAVFLAVASHAVAAPLNPAYTEDEFAFYMEDLGAKLLIVLHGNDTPARAAAARLGVPVVEAVPGKAAGSFTLAGAPEATAISMARMTWRSSCTHRAPLRGRRSCRSLRRTSSTSARSIAATLHLTADDRCLNVMPLFHIHGLIAAVLSSMSAGAPISCAPGFDALKFFGQARGGGPHLVHRRPHDASGDPAPRQAQRRHHREGAAPLYPLLLRLPPRPGPPRTGRDLRLPGDRGLRHDRSLPPDGLEPAAPGPAQARLRGRGRRPRGRGHGRGRRAPPPRAHRRDRDPGRQRHAGLPEQPQGQCRELDERLVPHRRPGRDG